MTGIRGSVVSEVRRILPDHESGTGYSVLDLARAAYGARHAPSRAQRSAVARALRRLGELGLVASEARDTYGRGVRVFYLAPGVPEGDVAAISHPEYLGEPIVRPSYEGFPERRGAPPVRHELTDDNLS